MCINQTNYFITGTDTGVGKTYVSALLSFIFSFHYWKVIQCGLSTQTDTEYVTNVLGPSNIKPPVYELSTPASPHLSAEIDGVEIDTHLLIKEYKKLKNPTLIEGAGGILVPIKNTFLMIDLIKDFNCPVIVVSRTSIGTINHTLMTLRVLKEYQIPLHAVIFSGDYQIGLFDTIKTFYPHLRLFHIPFHDSWEAINFNLLKFNLRGLFNEL